MKRRNLIIIFILQKIQIKLSFSLYSFYYCIKSYDSLVSVRIEILLLLIFGDLERESEVLFKGISLSVYPSKHLGFSFKSEPRKLFV